MLFSPKKHVKYFYFFPNKKTFQNLCHKVKSNIFFFMDACSVPMSNWRSILWWLSVWLLLLECILWMSVLFLARHAKPWNEWKSTLQFYILYNIYIILNGWIITYLLLRYMIEFILNEKCIRFRTRCGSMFRRKKKCCWSFCNI